MIFHVDLHVRLDERRKRRQADLERTRFRYVNERLVNDVTLEILYKPHTITVLVLLAAYLLYNAFFL